LISVGALTKHIQAVDFSLRFDAGDAPGDGTDAAAPAA